jgi:hypothetical protein
MEGELKPDNNTQLFRIGPHIFYHPTPERIAFLQMLGCPMLALVKHGAPRKPTERNIEDLVFALSQTPPECIAILGQGYEQWRKEAAAYRGKIGEADYRRIMFQLGFWLNQALNK